MAGLGEAESLVVQRRGRSGVGWDADPHPSSRQWVSTHGTPANVAISRKRMLCGRAEGICFWEHNDV